MPRPPKSFICNRISTTSVCFFPEQSIFRIFRIGQKKPCYVYRLVAMGTLEEIIYKRSLTKQAISVRVVDDLQIKRQYTYAELQDIHM